jgi:acyl-coenzyme A thioesterase PaaI-like protein
MNKQANSRQCFVCGVENPFGLHLKFYEEEPGRVSAVITVPEHFQGYPGVVHGGIIAAMLDEVSGRTMLRGDPPRWMVTAKLDIRYRKPVPTETKIYLEGRAKEDNGKVAVVTGTIFSADRTILAESEAVMVNLPGKLAEQAAFGPEDWKVYPDQEVSK